MSLTSFETRILQLLASSRSAKFQDTEEQLESCAQADEQTVRNAGFTLRWLKVQSGKREAEIQGLGEAIRLEWVHDSAFRFFAPIPDPLFGYVLHPIDLATNKASAAADRREPRDIVDLVTIHQTILPLGAVLTAAVGRFPGQSPEEMLADITRHSRFTAEEFRALSTAEPIDIPQLHKTIRAMLDEAAQFIQSLPTSAIGVIFLENGKPVQPDPSRLGTYQTLSGSIGGIWPSSPQISSSMLQAYRNNNPQ